MPVAITSPTQLDGRQLASVLELAGAVEAADGAPPLSDPARSRLRSGGVRHLVASQSGAVVGYAQLDGDAGELVAEPVAIEALLDSMQEFSPALVVWAHGQRSRLVPVLERRRYRAERVLWQLRCKVAELTPAPPPSGVVLRPFEVGRDEAGWLAVNAAAFAHHPEQANLTRGDLAEREAEPWFDPAGFLLAVTEAGAQEPGTIVGFHWTKRHTPSLGEVYVLGVAPQEQGRRLGQVLLIAGLDHLRRAGVTEVLLYVDETNTAAMALYEKYGFARYDRDTQYRRESNS